MMHRAVALTVLLLALCAAPAFGAAKTPDQVLHTKSSSGLALMTAFSSLLVAKDKPAIANLLSRAFQIQRTDGSHANRAQYLAKLPDLRDFAFTDVTQQRANGFVTVRMQTTATLFINGALYSAAPAPQLVAFAWLNDRWMLIAQGNFNLPAA